jgi:peptidoglycan/LPS O-acetylase OafA/YrhL
LACIVAFHLVDLRDYNPVVTVFFTVLLGMSAFGKVPILRWKPIAFVAGASYSLYLLHNNLGSTVIYHLDGWIGPWPALLAATALIFVVAPISTHWFENPLCNRLRRWWMGPRTAVPTATPQPARATTPATPFASTRSRPPEWNNTR